MALTRLSFLAGPYHQKQRRDEGCELAGCQISGRDLLAAVPQRGRHAQSSDELHEWREARQGRGDLHVGPEEMPPGTREALGLFSFRAERLHDAVAGEGLDADMGNQLQRLLTAFRGLAHTPPQLDEGIDDEWRAREADNGQARIVVEEQTGVPDERQRLAGQIASGLGHHLLHLRDVVVHARQQLARSALGEETC